jgi:hypothetical protein
MRDILSRIIHLTSITLGRRRVVERRRYFYDAVLKACSGTLDQAAVMMGQDQYYVPADTKNAILSPEFGLLIFHIDAEFHGILCRHTYSLYQLGDVFKIGLLLPQQLEKAFLVDYHGELGKLWNRHKCEQSDRDGTTLYEWTFHVPSLYRSWIDQEGFVLGMRHCHQRVLRVFHDYALGVSQASPVGHSISQA